MHIGSIHISESQEVHFRYTFKLEVRSLEKDELEKANTTTFTRNSTQRGFSRIDYPSNLASGLSYSDTSYASASNITPPGPFNPYFHVGTHMQSAE